MSWSEKLAFFTIFSFAIFVIARGDGPRWKAIFTTKLGPASGGTGGTTLGEPGGIFALPALPALPGMSSVTLAPGG